jgi:hypothetical protein
MGIVRRLGVIDAAIIIAIAASAVAFIPVMNDAGPAVVCVRCDDRVVTIDSAGVAVLRATCRNRICMHTGHIRRPGQQILCAPNHVVIEIMSAHANDAPDAVAR